MTPTKKIKQGLPFQELVGSVVKAFDPQAVVKTEQWVNGPDGRRDMDVLIQGKLEDKPFRLLIECKDYDLQKTGKVGIEYVDALDSKRKDLQVDGAMICSNSGFTADAVRKAKRVNIGLISILKSGDRRVKAVIEEEIYTRQIRISNIKTTFHGDCPNVHDDKEITYRELPVINWVMRRIMIIVSANSILPNDIFSSYSFLAPIELAFAEKLILIKQIDVRFYVEISWYSQIVKIDASLGMYDYIRGKVQLAPGQNQYIINGVDIYRGTPIDFLPEQKELGMGLRPGELDIALMLVKGLDISDPEMIPDLDPQIVPSDLEWKNYS